jgi:hypothetical protein
MKKEKAPKAEKHPLSELDQPILPATGSGRNAKLDLLVNEKSDIWLLYDRPFSETVKWAEYDLELNKIYLVLLSGRQQEVGLVIADEMADLLKKGRQMYLVHMKDKSIADCGMVPLIVR